MSNNCKIEFYFKVKDIEALLKANPDAEGIIIKQELKPREKPDGKGFESVATIKAYTKGTDTTRSMATAASSIREIDGCPYPPGCTKAEDIVP